MIKNYLIVAWRNIKRQKVYSFIKVFGLSIGIAACILIYLFVVEELSFDRFHENGDRLFQVFQVRYDKDTGEETGRQQFLPTPTGPELKQSLPGIRHQTRFVRSSGAVRYKESIFRENIWLADSPFFEMFTFPLIEGDPITALSDDHSAVLSRSTAEKYFKEEDPLGKTLTFIYGHVSKDYVVTGVAEDVPPNSSIQFDILIHFNNLPTALNNPDILNNWARWYCPLFVQLQPEVSVELAEESLSRFCTQYFSPTIQEYVNSGYDPFTFGLESFKEVYLDTRIAGNTGLSPSYILSAIAFAILLIACVNFMNLSIGLSSVRSMEVGIRKVLGAERRQLLWQFWGEALLVSFMAIIVGIMFADLLLPQFNVLSGKHLTLTTLFNGFHMLVLLAIAVFTGMCAGSYPSIVISAFRPADIMKGKLKIGGRTTLTKGLVVLQFVLSVILALSAIILGRQVSYMVNRDPGYVSEGLVVVMTQENEQEESERLTKLYRSEVISSSKIQGLTASNREFGLFLPGSTLEWGERKIFYRFNRVDPYFLSTMKLELIQGRDFSSNLAADRDAVIVNQRFMEELGPDYRIGSTLGNISKGFPYNYRIIGVMEDCHFESLRNEIDPLLLYVGQGESQRRNRFSRIIVRVETGQIKETMDFLEKAWKKTQPDKPFICLFQEDALESLYNREKRWSAIVRYASVFSILLACLGIFGLTAMTLSRREKEIGIRKVLGAKVEQIVYLASKEFVLLISIANVIAWPVVFIVMKKILQNYPYRIPIGIHYFLLTGAASLLVAVLTILYLSVKSALRNPVDSLRYE
jgi:putative ABC transport system permease protein